MMRLKIRQLKTDPSLYPRASVDLEHVERIVQAIQAGAKFPPLVVCKHSKRVVDGWHRREAFLRLLGPDHELECIEKNYRNDEEFFLDQVRYNSEHGLVMGHSDRRRIMNLGRSLSIDADRIAAVLKISVTAAKTLSTVPASPDLRVQRPAQAKPVWRGRKADEGDRFDDEAIESGVERGEGEEQSHDSLRRILLEDAAKIIDKLKRREVIVDDFMRGRLTELHQAISDVLDIGAQEPQGDNVKSKAQAKVRSFMASLES